MILNIALLDDTLNVLSGLPSFSMLADHRVEVFREHTTDENLLASRLANGTLWHGVDSEV